jgi:hypothetical protein
MENITMKNRTKLLMGVSLVLALHGAVVGLGKASATSVPFEVASVRFEQNATDGDVEVVFEVKGGDDGLAKLTVVSPDGRTVFDFTAPDASTLGIRQFNFESPEPGNADSLKAAYPEGVYSFSGATTAGEKLHGEATLHHALPATVSFVRPGADARDVSATDLEITWTPVKNLAAYIVEIEQEELEVNITAKLPGSVSTFAVPQGFLRAGTEYQVGIGTVAGEGNVSFVETSFTTAATK